MSRGGRAAGCSRGSRDASPKSASFTSKDVGVDEDVVGFQVLVDNACLVKLRDRPRDGNRERQKAIDRHRRPAEQPAQGLAAEVLEDEGGHTLVGLEGERFDDGRGVDLPADFEFVLELLEVLRAAALRIEHFEDHGAAIGVPDRAKEGGSAALNETRRDRVRSGGAHGEISGRAKSSTRWLDAQWKCAFDVGYNESYRRAHPAREWPPRNPIAASRGGCVFC